MEESSASHSIYSIENNENREDKIWRNKMKCLIVEETYKSSDSNGTSYRAGLKINVQQR